MNRKTAEKLCAEHGARFARTPRHTTVITRSDGQKFEFNSDLLMFMNIAEFKRRYLTAPEGGAPT